jgi:hypothetical protein
MYLELNAAKKAAQILKKEIANLNKIIKEEKKMSKKSPLEAEGDNTGVAIHVREMAVMVMRKNELADELEAIKARIAEKEEPAMYHFQQMGYSSVKINGINLHLRRRIAVGKKPEVEPEEMARVLEAVGMGDYVRPSVNEISLSSYYREIEDQLIADGKIPDNIEDLMQPEVREVLNINEVITLGARKA